MYECSYPCSNIKHIAYDYYYLIILLFYIFEEKKRGREKESETKSYIVVRLWLIIILLLFFFGAAIRSLLSFALPYVLCDSSITLYQYYYHHYHYYIYNPSLNSSNYACVRVFVLSIVFRIIIIIIFSSLIFLFG